MRKLFYSLSNISSHVRKGETPFNPQPNYGNIFETKPFDIHNLVWPTLLAK